MHSVCGAINILSEEQGMWLVILEKQAKEAKEARPLTEEAAALEPLVGSGVPRNLTFPTDGGGQDLSRKETYSAWGSLDRLRTQGSMEEMGLRQKNGNLGKGG